MKKKLLLALTCVAGVTGAVIVARAQNSTDSKYTNLQVLPADISESELIDIMLENLHGLGLPRRAGEGCLVCHEGDLKTPRSEWDYASDAKPMKEKARTMMAMVKAINEEHLPQLPSRIDPTFEVSCTTCHAGRLDPRPLPTVLWETYERDGIDATTQQYRALRDRYFGRDSYDFRLGVLRNIALRMADQGAMEDAITLARTSVDVHPDETFPKQAWIALQLEHIIDTQGVNEALAELDHMQTTIEPGMIGPGLLDALAWRLIRSERESAGHALIEANYKRFPETYRATESMAFMLADTDRMPQAIQLLENWLNKHPDDVNAQRVLVNLREE